MNKVLKIVTALTWVNVIFWGFMCFAALLLALILRTPAALLTVIFPGAIVLHSYASFQLQKSIRNPAVPLNHQTPTGIRFIGFVALFVGISMIFQGISSVVQPHTYVKQMQEFQEQMNVKSNNFVPSVSMAIGLGVFLFLIGLCVAVNVNLNFRLLRWYNYIRNDSNKSQK